MIWLGINLYADRLLQSIWLEGSGRRLDLLCLLDLHSEECGAGFLHETHGRTQQELSNAHLDRIRACGSHFRRIHPCTIHCMPPVPKILADQSRSWK